MRKFFIILLSSSVLITIFSLLTSLAVQNKNVTSNLQTPKTLGVENYLAQACTEPSGGCGTNYYWNSATCACQYYCNEPSGGCGSGYYWNSSTCSCQSNCSPPSTGCGTNYYWDQAACMCKTSTCSPPTSGCPVNYYWDTTTCSCKISSTTCNPPSSGCGDTGWYWDYSACACIYTSSQAGQCSPPSTGCGLNYYWDLTTCSCKPSSSGSGGGGGGTSCITPSAGCGTNYYWDSGTCSCKSYSTCSPPTNGCGYNYYWDYSSCSCRYYSTSTSTCQPPSTGCGSNSYWDSYSCSCKTSSGSSSCSPPTSGCGTNYYWDSYSCTCKSQYSTCYPPTSGCGSTSYWDSYYCSCRPYTTATTSYCSPPQSGCGYNYYWDQYSCSCKYYTSSCVPPPAGCGTNKYWDYYLCNCKDYQAGITTSCVQPAAGCGYNYYWDSSACFCKPSPNVTSCPTPTVSCTSNSYWDSYSCSCKTSYPYYQQENFDRFAYESPERISCVKSLLTSYEFERLRYFIPTNSLEQNEIYNLGGKVKTCWNYLTTDTQNQPVLTPGFVKSPIDYESCLIRALGETAYKEIYSGVRTPSYQEHLKYEVCFGEQSKTSQVAYYTNEEKIPKTTDACLRTVLGGGLYEKVKNGSSGMPYDLVDKANRCFGINPQPFEEGRVYKIPDQIKSCLTESLGEQRHNEINSGSSQPTDDEKMKGSVCFAQLNRDQSKFLPPPIEKVHFLESDPEVVKLSEVKQETQVIGQQTAGGNVVFAGQSLANTTVYIYIFSSDPIVVTTKTDENGDWVYELNQPLNGEKHIAYAAVRNEKGNYVRSSVFDFTVVAAETDIQNQLVNESQLTRNTGRDFVIRVLALIFVLVVVVLLVFSFVRALRKKTPTPKVENLPNQPEDSNNTNG